MNTEYTTLSAQLFERNLRDLSENIIWKDQQKAIADEDDSEYMNVDRYLSAARQLLRKFSASSLKSVPDQDADYFAITLENTPSNLKDAMVLLHIYEEHNDYYRVLSGKPPKKETKFLYVKGYEEDGIDPNTPIHLLPIIDKYKLESFGVLAEIIKENPDKKYLQHLTSKNIPPFLSRMAEKFSLLYVPETTPANLAIDFTEVYELCRSYMIRVFYTQAFRSNEENYDNFIALAILFMTIQQMHYRYLDADITRDFYDLDSLKVVYASYGVPFYETIPLEFHQRIVKAINQLISYKGGNQVFFDLCAIFDYNSLEIFQYYLLKTHKTDIDNRPIFVYNNDGSLDLEKSFDICFVRSNINEDPYLQITDGNNHIPYKDVVDDDRFWIQDDDLKKVIFNTEYNFIETKYIGAQLMFSVTQMLFESAYFLKMLSDNRKTTQKIRIYHDYIGKQVSLFALVIHVYAAICKKHGYEGNIPMRPEQIAKVYGFNFKDDLKKIRNDIIANKYLDNEIAEMLINMNVSSLESVHSVFRNIRMVSEFIEDKMWETKDKDVFIAYSDLRKTLLTTELIPDVFRKGNGEIAKSFKDLLADVEPSLSSRLDDPTVNLTVEINYCLVQLKKLSTELKYLEFADSLDIDIIIDYLYKMLAFFKSAKAELAEFNVIFMIDSTVWNLLKFMTHLQYTNEYNYWPNDGFNRLMDVITDWKTQYAILDKDGKIINFKDFMLYIFKKIYIDEDLPLYNKLLHYITTIYDPHMDNIPLRNFLANWRQTDQVLSNLSLKTILTLKQETPRLDVLNVE